MYYAGTTGIAIDAAGILARERARVLHQNGATPEQVAATGYHYTGVPGQYAPNFSRPAPVRVNLPAPVHIGIPVPMNIGLPSQEHVPPYTRPENPYAGFYNTQIPERPSWMVPAVAAGVILAVTVIGVGSYYAKKHLGGDTP